MLSQLTISNIAVISNCEITLSGGFNVLTGETGAGKSLIIDSLNMVLGHRGNRELIRHGEKKARVEAVFFLSDAEKVQTENEIGEFEGNDLILSREIFDDGRNICKINGETATVSKLKSVSEILVNIHGQNDGQKLLSKANHIEFLDAFSENSELLSEYKAVYNRIKSAEKELSLIQTDESEKLKRLDMLRFWLDEIDKADLVPSEEEELTAKLKVIRNAEKLKRDIINAHEGLYGDNSVYSYLSNVCDLMNSASNCDEELKPFYDELSDILYRVQDISREISYYGSGLDFDGSELSDIEERLYLIQKLKTKYGSSIDEVLSYADSLREEIKTIEFSGERAQELNLQIEKDTKTLENYAAKLSEKRKKSAEIIDKSVKEELSYLDMEKVNFSVSITEGELSGNGRDKVEFLIATNPSEPLKPLTSVASGGEMSRVCLAIKTVLSDADSAGSLIFDEIDSGVSGKAAEKIGLKLKKLGEHKQVICITHLPQIAAKGTSHFLIEKHLVGDSFNTDVNIIEGDERISEIARIISGETVSETAKETAREMLENI